MTTVHNMQLSLDELAQTIRDGKLPDGSDTCDSVLLDSLAEALNALDEIAIDYLFEVTGGSSAIAECTAAKLISVEALGDSYSIDNGWACDTVTIDDSYAIDSRAGDTLTFDNSDQSVVVYEFKCSENLWLENGTCDFCFVHEVFKGANNAAPHEMQSPHAFVWIISNGDALRPWTGFFDDNGLQRGSPILPTSSQYTTLSTVGGKTCAQSFPKALPTTDLASIAIANVQRRRSEWSETESD
jgi:hypothetical protein